MAPSKRISLAFLLAALAVVALQPSAAVAREVVVAATKVDDQQEDSSSTSSWWRRPSFPCIPGLPRLPWLPPCDNNSTSHGGGDWSWPHPTPMPPAPPQPAECGTPLKGMMPCADFLTKADVTAPPAACCDGFKAVVKDAPICMCHVVNRDFSKLLPAPMLRLRMMMLPRACGAPMPIGTLRQCIRGPVPPMNPPPSSPTSP